ncbi:MAG: ABC transporter permease [Ekhidna sp.]
MTKFPKWASLYMSLFCDSEIQEELEGDILSNYHWRIENNQRVSARLHFLRDVLFSTRFMFSRNSSAASLQLLLSTFTIYWRNIKRNKVAFLLNIFGLFIGVFCFLAIYSFHEFENSYDRQYTKADQIFRIEKVEYDLEEKRVTGTSYLLPEFVANQIAEVSNMTGVINMRYDRANLQYPKGNPWHRLTLTLAKPNFFEVFDFEFLEGSPDDALTDTNRIVITESTRRKLFKENDAYGKVLYVNEKPYEVSGVILFPENTHFEFDFIINYEVMFSTDFWDKEKLATDWHYADFIFHYAQIPHGKEKEVIESINRLYAKHKHEDKPEADFQLHSVSDIHLDESTDWELSENGNAYFVQMMMILALIVIVLVAVNYSFINIAQTSNRIKELGLRNILGSTNTNLLSIIVIENIISISFASVVAALAILWLPDNLPLQLPITIHPEMLLTLKSTWILLGLILLLSLLASIFPMLLIQSLQPILALKGRIASRFGHFSLLKSLVTVQVMISLGLIISMIIFHRQISFLMDKDPGFAVQHIGYLERYDRGDNRPSYEAFKEELLQIPGINSVTSSAQIPLRWPAGNNYELILKGEEEGVLCSRAWIDYDYFETLEITMQEGRDYSKQMTSDTNAIIIGASAAKQLGLDDPLGKTVKIFFRGGAIVEEKTIIGVVEDFNYRTFHSQIMPHYYMLAPNGPVITINFADIHNQQVHEQIQTLWPSYSPNEAYNFTYMENHYEKQYQSDLAQRNAIFILAGVVLLLASLGIFGISSFVAKKATKAVSIRKVLGARVSELYIQQAKQYVIISVISFLLCMVPVYLIAFNWLQGYAYRIVINPMYFVTGLAIVILIIVAVVTGNILKIATLNPVNTLKDE